MRVIVPFTEISPETSEALDASGYPWEGIDVSDSVTAYYEVLDDLWRIGEDFVLIEHDIVVNPGTLKSFDECPNDWCASPYPYLGDKYSGLGCTRFRSSLIRAHPNAVIEAGNIEYGNHERHHWCTMDDALTFRTLASYGLVRCLHEDVGHVGDQMPSHLICRPSWA